MWGRKDWGQGPGPRASHTPKAGLGSNSWAGQRRLREALQGQEQPGGPVYTEFPGCVTPSQTLGHAEPGFFVSSIPECLSFISGPGSTLACPPPTLPYPSIVSREAVSGEEGDWGCGRWHPGSPSGLTQENLRMGKIPASHLQPCWILVPMETSRSSPC